VQVQRVTSNAILFMASILFVSAILFGNAASAQQHYRIQQAVDAIKTTFTHTDEDYITDGQRTVWVKSYRKWIPQDLAIMQKEVPGTMHFLVLAAQHNRYDVLEQLLPDYYRTHGGVKAFAADVMKEQGSMSRAVKTKASL